VQRLFQDLWSNEDARKNRLAADFMQGTYGWLAEGAFDHGLSPEDFKTRSFHERRDDEALAQRQEVSAPIR
jgi:hypothetical protein